jgi:hypothetical protein
MLGFFSVIMGIVYLAIVLFTLSLAYRLVRAVERIADKMPSTDRGN